MGTPFYNELHNIKTKSGLTSKDIKHRILGICTKVDKDLEKASLDGADSNPEVYNRQLASKIETWFADDGAKEWNRTNPHKKVPEIEWMAVLNPNKHEAEANMTFSDASKKEEWFYDVLFQGEARKQCGIDAVRTRLMQKYSEFCTNRVQKTIWPATNAKLLDTNKSLKNDWGWDPREEGTDADKRSVIAEAASQLLDETASSFKSVWAQPQVKESLAECAQSSSITACRKSIVGNAADPTKPGIVTQMLKQRAQGTIESVGSKYQKLRKFVKM